MAQEVGKCRLQADVLHADHLDQARNGGSYAHQVVFGLATTAREEVCEGLRTR